MQRHIVPGGTERNHRRKRIKRHGQDSHPRSSAPSSFNLDVVSRSKHEARTNGRNIRTRAFDSNVNAGYESCQFQRTVPPVFWLDGLFVRSSFETVELYLSSDRSLVPATPQRAISAPPCSLFLRHGHSPEETRNNRKTTVIYFCGRPPLTRTAHLHVLGFIFARLLTVPVTGL